MRTGLNGGGRVGAGVEPFGAPGRAAPSLVLDLDPGLGSAVAPADWDDARRACRGTLLHARRGTLDPGNDASGDGAPFALIVIDGLLCRESRLAEHHLLELLGAGDVIQFPATSGPKTTDIPTLVALEDSRFVALADAYLQAASRFPALLACLLERLEIQRARLARQALISHIARADHRLLLILQHLAERWGRTTSKGTVLPLALTHQVLAHLTSSRRPTVTLAARTLSDEGCVRRLSDKSWVLTPLAKRKLDTIAAVMEPGLDVTQTLRVRPMPAATLM
jgi:CRP-like cAMP-binding protein